MATIPKLIAPRHIDRAIQFASNSEIARIIAPIRRSDMPGQPGSVLRAACLVLEVGKNITTLVEILYDSPALHGEPLRRVDIATESKVDKRSGGGQAGVGFAISVADRRPHPY